MGNGIVILGAGLAGLSAAHHLRRGYTILEKEGEVGGLCRSTIQEGFVFDRSIHILFPQSQYARGLIHELLRGNLLSQTRESWIYSHHTYTRYPFQANLYGLPINVVKDCLLGLIEAKICRTKPSATPGNFHDWVYSTFGRGIAEHFMLPYNAKQWAIAPRLMNCDWISGRVLEPTIEEVLDGALTEQPKGFGPNAQFDYPARGGIGALPRSFSNVNNIKLNAEVTGISLRDRTVEYRTRDETVRLPFSKIISTLPLPMVIQLMDLVPEPVKQAVEALKYNSVLCVNLGIDRPNLSDKHWIYVPEGEFVFHRIFFPMNFSPQNAPPGKSSVSAEISVSKYKSIEKQDLEERVISDLTRMGILRLDDTIRVRNVMELSPAYVIYDLTHRGNVNLIHKFLKENDIYPCGRYGDWEYLNMDDAIISGKRASEEAAR